MSIKFFIIQESQWGTMYFYKGKQLGMDRKLHDRPLPTLNVEKADSFKSLEEAKSFQSWAAKYIKQPTEINSL